MFQSTTLSRTQDVTRRSSSCQQLSILGSCFCNHRSDFCRFEATNNSETYTRDWRIFASRHGLHTDDCGCGSECGDSSAASLNLYSYVQNDP